MACSCCCNFVNPGTLHAVELLLPTTRSLRLMLYVHSSQPVATETAAPPAGVIACNGVNGSPRSEALPAGAGIQGEFALSNTQDGLLATAFLVGLLIASPLFSEAVKRVPAFTLLAIGMGIWCAATLGCGLSTGFAGLIFCRCGGCG